MKEKIKKRESMTEDKDRDKDKEKDKEKDRRRSMIKEAEKKDRDLTLAELQPKADKFGYLQNQTTAGKPWKKFYFVLKGASHFPFPLLSWQSTHFGFQGTACTSSTTMPPSL